MPGFFTRCKEKTVETVQIVKVVEIEIAANLRQAQVGESRFRKRRDDAVRRRNSETGLEVRDQTSEVGGQVTGKCWISGGVEHFKISNSKHQVSRCQVSGRERKKLKPEI